MSPASSGSLLVGADQTPQPPADLVRRLAALDSRLFVKYWAASWRVFRHWPLDDPRWLLVQRKELSEAQAHDLLFALPVWLGVDEIAPYLERELRSSDQASVRRLVEGMAAWNEGGPAQAAIDESVAEVVEQTVKDLEPPRTAGRRTRHVIPKSEG